MSAPSSAGAARSSSPSTARCRARSRPSPSRRTSCGSSERRRAWPRASSPRRSRSDPLESSRTTRGKTRALAARTISKKRRAAAMSPTSRPTPYSQVKSAALVLRKPLKTNSGYCSGCARMVTVARWFGRSCSGGMSTVNHRPGCEREQHRRGRQRQLSLRHAADRPADRDQPLERTALEAIEGRLASRGQAGGCRRHA